MKKYFFSFVASIIACFLFAFTRNTKIVFTNYVWYSINTSVHKPCDFNLGNITLSDLMVDSKYTSTSAGFEFDIADVTFGAGNDPNIFICDLVNEELCAVGFLKPPLGTTGFTVYNGKWIPLITPSVQTCMTEFE